MGKFKTGKGKEMQTLRKAHMLAEAFALNKTKGFLDKFLQQSGLGDVMWGYYQDIQFSWKKALEEKKLALEAANVQGDEIKKQTLQNEIEDLEANIDEPLMDAKEYLTKLQDDLNIPFGGALALAYAMGYADRANGATVRTINAMGKTVELAEQSKQLDLPGFHIADENTKSPLIGETTPEHVAMVNAQPRIITDLNVVK